MERSTHDLENLFLAVDVISTCAVSSCYFDSLGWVLNERQPHSVFSPPPPTSHDTQTTHWDSPRGIRQQKQLQELKTFLQSQKDKLKVIYLSPGPLLPHAKNKEGGGEREAGAWD